MGHGDDVYVAISPAKLLNHGVAILERGKTSLMIEPISHPFEHGQHALPGRFVLREAIGMELE